MQITTFEIRIHNNAKEEHSIYFLSKGINKKITCILFFYSVTTLEMVKAGEELTVHYMMDMEDAPDWYMEAWDKYST